jgi:hypothetical protein
LRDYTEAAGIADIEKPLASILTAWSSPGDALTEDHRLRAPYSLCGSWNEKGRPTQWGAPEPIPATIAAEAEEWLTKLSSESGRICKPDMNGSGTPATIDDVHPQLIHRLPTV